MTAQRYADMKQVAATVSDRLSQLNEKYEVLKPFLQQIDEIDASSRKMENAVQTLENYVNSLGNQSFPNPSSYLESKLKKIQQNQSTQS